MKKRRISYDKLYNYYIKKDLTVAETAKKLKAGTHTIRRELKRHNLSMTRGEKKSTHGMSDTRQYRIWQQMKNRCDNPNNIKYDIYGGKGITYGDKWKTFQGFWEDMKEGYSDDLTLDRIDREGDYTKENCRWVDYEAQNNNTDFNIILEYQGKKMTVPDLLEMTELPRKTIYSRINAGWTAEEIIENPKPLKGKKIKQHGRNKKPVLQLDKNGNVINEYDSQTEASKKTGVDRSNLGKCCRGEQKTAGGFVWKFKNEEE